MGFDWGSAAGGALSLVGNIAGGAMSARASRAAADEQAAQAEAQRQFILDMYNRQVEQNKPWYDAAKNALAQLVGYTTGGQEMDMSKIPGYQFRFDEGQRALDRSAAARGMLMSGRQAKAQTQYGQQFASNEYNQALNRLAALAGTGQTGAFESGAMSSMAPVFSQLADAGATRAGAYNALGGSISRGAANLSDLAQYWGGSGGGYGGQTYSAPSGSSSGGNPFQTGAPDIGDSWTNYRAGGQ